MTARYVPVPRDLSKVKSKVFLNLTKRQLICFGLAALVGIPCFFLFKFLSENISTSVMGMMIVMLPFFFFAMYQKNGQTLEVYLAHFIEYNFIRPKVRFYETDNLYDAIIREEKATKEVEKIVQDAIRHEKEKHSNT